MKTKIELEEPSSISYGKRKSFKEIIEDIDCQLITFETYTEESKYFKFDGWETPAFNFDNIVVAISPDDKCLLQVHVIRKGMLTKGSNGQWTGPNLLVRGFDQHDLLKLDWSASRVNSNCGDINDFYLIVEKSQSGIFQIVTKVSFSCSGYHYQRC